MRSSAVYGLVLAAASVACSASIAGLPNGSVETPHPIRPPRPVHVTLAADVAVHRAEATGPCPPDMVHIEGDYCPRAEEVCLRWQCGDGRPGCAPDKAHPTSRCAEYRRPTRCLSQSKVHVSYCIDRYEWPNVAGQVPESWLSWTTAGSACVSRGRRLCTQPEWTFACEGPEMQPYPYGDGYHRDLTACNFDNPIPSFDRFTDTRRRRVLDALLVGSGDMPRCVSPFGVHDQVGNLDEFVVDLDGHHQVDRDDHGPFVSGLMGGHVFGVRNNCRAITPGHNESFAWYETGSRCCLSP